ncbi:hypothetical protein O6H91_04G025900 [Diphasiastrum complanatum]|uniref:Uncharacterized protein n=1 Tax=Diphasiastrum complanatum TaxID=34168 RepID=A0ACC2DV87_DIPCM|nr:hypothetical protein O6H91_04G025900 [Diphasiastrum complanatum]
MAKLQIHLLLLLLLACLCNELAVAKSSSSAIYTSRKEDIKFIRCGICEEIAKELSRQVKKKRDELHPKKLTELQIIDVAENICNLKREEGDWILRLDIVEEGDALKLAQQNEGGECRTECKTIERACKEVMGDHDTDLAEFIFKGGEGQRAALTNLLCKDLSKACVGKTPSVPKDRVAGEPFVPKSSKDAEMERLMRSMSDMPGAPGMKMYSKEDLMGMRGNFGAEDEDEDEDEDEGDDDIRTIAKASNLAGLKGKQAAQTGWKEHATTLVKSALQKTNHLLFKGSEIFVKWVADIKDVIAKKLGVDSEVKSRPRKSKQVEL